MDTLVLWCTKFEVYSGLLWKRMSLIVLLDLEELVDCGKESTWGWEENKVFRKINSQTIACGAKLSFAKEF